MRSILFSKRLRWYYCSSALDRRRVWGVPYLSALETPQSKLRTGIRSLSANHEIDVATQQNFCAANQDTAEHSKISVQPIRSEKIKQWHRDRPRSDALVLRAAPASMVEYRLKNCLDLSASSMPSLGFLCVTHRMNISTNMPAI